MTDTIKLADHENPLVGARIWGLSPAEAVKPIVLKIANFRCHGNKGMSEPNVTGIVKLADPENHTMEPKITHEALFTTINGSNWTLFYIQPKLWQFFW